MSEVWGGMGVGMENANVVGRGESSDGVYAGEIAGVIGGEIQGWKAGGAVE